MSEVAASAMFGPGALYVSSPTGFRASQRFRR